MLTLCAGSHSSSTSNTRQSEYGELPDIQPGGEYGQADAVSSIALPSSGETALAYVRSYSGELDDAMDDSFFKDYENHLDQIAQDDLTYVFGCTFYTDKP
jgi:hypothetical protein